MGFTLLLFSAQDDNVSFSNYTLAGIKQLFLFVSSNLQSAAGTEPGSGSAGVFLSAVAPCWSGGVNTANQRLCWISLDRNFYTNLNN